MSSGLFIGPDLEVSHSLYAEINVQGKVLITPSHRGERLGKDVEGVSETRVNVCYSYLPKKKNFLLLNMLNLKLIFLCLNVIIIELLYNIFFILKL